MFARSLHRTSILLSLLAVLALTASGAISAQSAPNLAHPVSTTGVNDSDFRSSPVMFIENANKWDERSASQTVDENEADRTLVSQDAWNVELIGQVGGGTYAIAVQGNYAYLGVGPRLVVLNIADPAHPTAISQTSVLPDKLADVVVAGSYAYVANLQGGLRVINVASAAAPIEVGHCETPGSAYDVAIMGSYAYVADGSSGLRVIHIADPTAPVEVGHHDTPGEALGVAVAGNYAYVADQQGGLRVINIANPTSPTEVSFHRTFRAMAVAVSDGYAYVADEFNGFRVFRVTNPFAPTEVGKLTGVNAYDLVLGTGYAYVADEMRLVVVNIANPVSPIVVSSWRAPTYSFDFELHVTLAGDHALMARADSGLHVISVADPTHPTETSTYKSFLPQDNLAVANNRAFAVNLYPRFRMVDVSQPDKITTVGVCCEDTINLDVAAAGNYAYIASDFDGLRVIDASNPASPAVIGWYGNFWAADVEVRGRYAYVWGDGLRVFDVSTPSTPLLMGVLRGYGVWGAGIYSGNVAMTDNHAFAVPGKGDELEVYAIANPRTPSLIAQLRLPYRPKQVAISGNHLFIAAGDSGLRTMDVSNPRSPVEVASLQVPGDAKGVAVSDSYLFIGAGANGLRVMDISNPLAPIEVGYYEALPRGAGQLVVSEGLVYVLQGDIGQQGDLGLFVLRFGITPTAYTISGRVTDASGVGIPGVTVWAGFSRNTTTDASGNYTFTDLPAGTYTIRPDKEPCTFTPTTQTVTIPPGKALPDFTSVRLASGLDVCILEPGDILLKAGAPVGDYTDLIRFWIKLGGSYFTHSALYLGVTSDPQNPAQTGPRIAEAAGKKKVGGSREDEVQEIWLKETQWWNGADVTDWAVVRPVASSEAKTIAIQYARDKAADPNVVFSFLTDLDDEQEFYCSKLVWKSYQRAGVDVHRKTGLTGDLTSYWVTPEDLYFGSPVVQNMPGVDPSARAFIHIYSPAHITLIDPLGRRTGFDSSSGGEVNEIPGALYSGADAQIESITMAGLASPDGWRLLATGYAAGTYTLETGYLDGRTRNWVTHAPTSEGKIDEFPVHPPDYPAYLPLLMR